MEGIVPRTAKELSHLEVKRLQHKGGVGNATFAVGGVSGLLLQITPKGGRTWLLRTSVGGRRREIGLGGFPDVTLAQARERARAAKDQIRSGVDPVEARKAVRSALAAAQRQGLTFAKAVEEYLSAKLDSFKNAKHRDQWRNTLQTYAIPHLGKMLVQDIAVQDVLLVLNQPVAAGATDTLWQAKTETASRLRGRIEAVLSWATVSGHRSGDNPARWAGNLKELLPAASKVARKANQPALRVEDALAWFSELRKRDGMGSRCLEFAALTAARSQEVRGARWDEIDLAKALWVDALAHKAGQRVTRVLTRAGLPRGPLRSGSGDIVATRGCAASLHHRRASHPRGGRGRQWRGGRPRGRCISPARFPRSAYWPETTAPRAALRG